MKPKNHIAINGWTDDQLDLLQGLIDLHTPWTAISDEIGRTVSACQSKARSLKMYDVKTWNKKPVIKPVKVRKEAVKIITNQELAEAVHADMMAGFERMKARNDKNG